MADIGGIFSLFEAPFMAMETHREHGCGGCSVILAVACLIGVGVKAFDNTPPPTPITTQIRREVEKHTPHPINNWKIKRAEKRYKKEQEEARVERERQAALVEAEGVAPIKSDSRWTRSKEWLRDKLNKDHDKRHPEEDK